MKNNVSYDLFEYDICDESIDISKIDMQDYFKVVYDKGAKLKATKFVGVYQTADYRICVYPKIYFGDTENKVQAMQNFLFMLSYIYKFDFKDYSASSQQVKDYDFLEVLIFIFANRLFNILKSNLNKSYVSVDDECNFLKGSWRISEQLSRAPHVKHKFFVTYDEFTENNMLNRIFKFVAMLLLRISKSNRNITLLHQILLVFCDVDDISKPSKETIESIKFNRMNSVFEKMFTMAKMFLYNLTNDYTNASNDTFAFMFDMNLLFEKFIAEFIRKECLIPKGTIMKMQAHSEYLTVEKKFQLKPDILFSSDKTNKLIIDTKYKRLEKDDKGNYNISQADAYQMYAYAMKYDCPEIILLYPEHLSEIKPKYHFEVNKILQIKTVNICIDLKNKKAILTKELNKILN